MAGAMAENGEQIRKPEDLSPLAPATPSLCGLRRVILLGFLLTGFEMYESFLKHLRSHM